MTASKRVAKSWRSFRRSLPRACGPVQRRCQRPGVAHAPPAFLEALNVLVNNPNPGEPARVELADLLTQNPELFRRKAEEFTLQFGVDQPL